jgi:hypothetical protein
VSKRKHSSDFQHSFPFIPPSVSDPQRLLEQTKAQPSRELVESALSQLDLGLVTLVALESSLLSCEPYTRLLRWGCGRISQAMSPGQITDVLDQVAFEALAAGWIAHEAAVQANWLEKILLSPSAVSRGEGTDNGRKPGRKADEQ